MGGFTRKAVLAAAFACSLPVAAGAREPGAGGYKAYEFAEYTLITRDRAVAKELPSQAAQTRALLAKLLEREPRAGGTPNYIVYVPRDTWVRYFDDGGNSFAAFVPDRFANYLLVSSREALEELELRYAVRHAYTHLFLHTQFDGVHPWWFDEGLANVVQRSEFRMTMARVGYAPTYSGGWTPIDQVMHHEQPVLTCRTSFHFTPLDYPAFLLVYRGLISDAEFGGQMIAYLEKYNDLLPVDQAIQSSFGKSGEELNRALYTEGQPGRVIRLEIPALTPLALPPARDLSAEDITQLWADLIVLTGFKPERLPDVVDAMYRRAPESPRTVALKIRLAARARDDAQLDRLLRMADPHASDPRLARGAGLALFERLRADESVPGPTRQRLQDRAFDYLDLAAMSRPDDAEVIWAHAMLAAQSRRDLPVAVRRVQNARAILPTNADLTIAMAELKGALGESEERARLMKEAFRYSKSLEQRRWLSRQ